MEGRKQMDRMRMVHSDTLSCEPILRRMPNGELLLAAQCGDVKEPAPGNRVYVFHSSDNGETFTKPELIIPDDGNAVYLTEVSLFGDTVVVFLTLHNGSFLNWRVCVVISRDYGYTWEIIGSTEHLPTYTFYRGMVTLKNGNILIPYQHYDISQQENDRLLAAGLKWKDADIHEVQNGVIISSDSGRSYSLHSGPVMPFGVLQGAQWTLQWVWSEPTIAELEDGTVSMLLRSNIGWLFRSDSRDGGRTWSAPVRTDIPNPSNKPKLIPMPDGEIALVHTPNPNPGSRGRNPLAIWFSKDGMRTWYKKHIVSDFPGRFCYADGFYENGHIMFSIEYNRHDILFVDHEIV